MLFKYAFLEIQSLTSLRLTLAKAIIRLEITRITDRIRQGDRQFFDARDNTSSYPHAQIQRPQG